MPSGCPCAARDCDSAIGQVNKVSLFKFPKNVDLRNEWINFVNITRGCQEGPKWTALPSSKLCSKHFVESDFKNRLMYNMGYAERLLLNKCAYPTIHSVIGDSGAAGLEHKEAYHRRMVPEPIQQTNPGSQSTNVTHKRSIHYGIKTFQSGDKLMEDIYVEEFPILEDNISDGRLLEKFSDDNDDIKIEEDPLLEWEDKNTETQVQYKTGIFRQDHTVSHEMELPNSNLQDKEDVSTSALIIQPVISNEMIINSIQMDTLSSLNFTFKKTTNIDELKPYTSQNMFSEIDKNENRMIEDANKSIENEDVNNTVENEDVDSIENKYDDAEKCIEIVDKNADTSIENYEDADKSIENVEKSIEDENAGVIIENDYSNSEEKYQELEFTDSENEEVDEAYKKEKADMILSKETLFHNEVKEKIFNEDNYNDCSFKNCDLIVYCEQMTKHLRDHESEHAKIDIIKNKDIRNFLCTDCGQTYLCFDRISNHIFIHFKEKLPDERVCTFCGYKSKRLSSFKIHKCNVKVDDDDISEVLQHENKSNTKIEKKSKIPKKVTIDREYNPSADSDNSDNAYESDYQEDSDNERQNIKDANSERLAKIKVSCNTCNANFDNETLCKEHLENDHNVSGRFDGFFDKEVNEEMGMETYLCLQCNMTFHNRNSCCGHLAAHHPSINYYCDLCKFVSSRKYLIYHIQKVHESERSTCNICNKSYASKAYFKCHIRNNHSSNPDKVKSSLCNICGKVFKKRHRLRRHMLTHSEVKPFACKLCEFSTVQKYNLVVHMQSHEKKGSIVYKRTHKEKDLTS